MLRIGKSVELLFYPKTSKILITLYSMQVLMRLVKIRMTALLWTLRWQVACSKCFMMTSIIQKTMIMNDEDSEDEDQEEQEEELTQPKRKKSVINFNNFFPASMLFFMMYGP